MSRTTRRNKKHLIERSCGTLAQAQQDSWWVRYRFPDRPLEQAYRCMVRRYIADNNPGRYSAPSWFARSRFNRPNRFNAKAEIRRCVVMNCWDDHIDPPNMQAALWYFW